jgi:PKD repeat protein
MNNELRVKNLELRLFFSSLSGRLGGAFLFFIFSCSFFTTNAQVWDTVGQGVNSGAQIESMVVVKDVLFVSPIGYADGIEIAGIGKWDGTNWDSLEHYQYHHISSRVLATFRDSLAAYGPFDLKSTAGAESPRIVFSDGNTFRDCLTCTSTGGVTIRVSAMAEYKEELYAGGTLTSIDGVSVNRIARWDGTTWRDVDGGVTNGIAPRVTSMAVYDSELYVAGDIRRVGSLDVNNIARWNGTEWLTAGNGLGTDGWAASMTVDTINNFLYVGGGFTTAEGIPVNGIAKWDGERWDSVGKPIAGALDMTMYRNKLYVGGSGSGVTDTIVAEWDGKNWKPIYGPNSTVFSLATYQDELYVGGAFSKINSADIVAIAKYKDTTTIKNCNYLQPRIFISYNTTDSSLVQFKNNNKYASNWEWDFDDGNQAFVQNPEHKYTDVGTYNVTVTVTHDGCTVSTTREVVVDKVLSTSQFEENRKLSIFPNPAKDEITIALNSKTLVNPKIEIYSLEGKKVKEIYEFGSEVKISLTDFSKGVYLVKLFDNGKELSSEKIVIE